MFRVNNSLKRKVTLNTLSLFVKTIVNTLITVYMVKLVLVYLGHYDFGVYTVVAGIVILFGFVSNSLSTATQRFFSFEIGRGDIKELSNIFTMFLNIYFLLSLILIIISEVVGAWFIENYLSIDKDILKQAIVVFRITVLSFVATMLRTPFLGYIIAKEKIHIIALLGVLEPVLKLIFIIYLIYFTSYENKLIAYSNIVLISTILTSIFSFYYINKHIKFTYFKFYWDKKIFTKLSSYSGWSLFGAIIGPINNQGFVLLINFFFNPIINTAFALAYQVMVAINMFAVNFQISMNPQIIKKFSSEKKDEMMELIFKSSKYCFFLSFIIGFPVILLTDEILLLWLNDIPKYTTEFTKLAIVIILIESVSLPLKTGAQASGNIKYYQLIIGSILLLNLPLSFYIFKSGFDPYYALFSNIILGIISLIMRIIILNRLIEMNPFLFMNRVLLRTIFVTLLPLICCFMYLDSYSESDLNVFAILILSFATTTFSIYFFGLDKYEKKTLKKLINKIYNNGFKKKH